MVALRVALVIAWIVAQLVGAIVAVLLTRTGFSSAGMAATSWASLCGAPALLGGGGLWVAERLARKGEERAEALALGVPFVLLVLATAVVLWAMA